MTSDPIQSAMHAALGTLFARMSRSQRVTFVVDGQRYDVACAAGDTARTVEASLRCAVAARKAGGMSEIGDWKQDGNGGWYREGSPVQAYRAGAYWGTCPHTGTTYSCPDAAREAADAHLVSQGRLPAERAFVRLGEWEEDGVSYHRTKGGTPCHHAYMVAQKAEVDAELVRRGLLAEERAFKVARPKLKPLAWDVGGGVTAVTGLAFGNAVPKHGNTTTAVVVNKRADGVSEVVGYAQDITKMPDDEINAMYGKHSEVARAMIGAKRRETRTVVHAVTNHGGAVTLATWEHHLPEFLDNAPREFRDGFNRRQGPAWEAYLRGLAGVREEIQCRKLRGSPGVTEVVLMAATKAHIILGPYWIDANVAVKR